MPQMVWEKGHFATTGAYLNLPAVLIVLAVTALLVRGIKESARINTAIVFVKVFVVLLFIVFAARFVRSRELAPVRSTQRRDIWPLRSLGRAAGRDDGVLRVYRF
jgi:amino acid transporter